MTTPVDTAALAAAGGDAATESGTTGLAAHAAALQTVLADLSTLSVQQLVAFFQQYQHAPNFPQILEDAFPQIVLPHANAAATVTAQWYDELQPKSKYTASPSVNLPQARLDGTLGWALYAPSVRPQALADPQGDLSQPVSPDVTLSRLAGSTKRMVYDASRDTVVTNAEQQGIRWARVAQPDACAFCRMLATKTGSSRALYTGRGVKVDDPDTGEHYLTVAGRSPSLTVGDRRMIASGQATRDDLLARRSTYSSAREAKKAGKQVGDTRVAALRGTQELGEKYHDHCRCTAVPVPDGETYQAPDYTAQWSQDYRDAVKAAKAAGQTKGEYGAIDFKSVLAHMRADTDAH